MQRVPALRSASLVGILFLVGTSLVAQEAPPPNDEAGPGVARISLLNGDVSVRRGDSTDAFAAALNAPLEAGDTIATGPNARAEVQFDFANRFRLGHDAEARIAELQSGHFRMELARGTASISVLRNPQAQLEVSTPNVSVRSTGQGLIRLWVRDDGQSVITVRHGQAEIFTEKGTERLAQGQTMFVRGSAQDPEYQVVPNTQTDEWDSWNEQRDRSLDRVSSYQYVNPSEYGVEDLDASGSWVNDPAYGEVWAPRVAPGWAPYQQGRWAWEDYYGWTWVSTDSWGWAPYHYGSWYQGSVGWCWYPGPIARPVFWRPALVAFFGFGGFGVGVGFGGWGNVGWLPLGPYEHFYPWCGRGGYRGVNVANVNVYNSYRNARITGAVSGVSAGAFTSGNFRSISRVSPGELQHAGLVRGGLPATPSAGNLRFSDRQTSVVPRAMGSNSRFFSRTPSAPVNRTSFEQQRQAVQRSNFGSSASSSNSRQSGDNSGWGRFGTPSRPGVSANTTRPANPTSASSSSWGRFGSPNVNRPAGATGYSAGNGDLGAGQRSYAASGSQSVRIAPSIVHDRAYDQPARSYGSAEGYRAAPSYSQPRSYGAPSETRSSAPAAAPRSSGGAQRSASSGRSAPASHGGGGGGHRR